MDSANVRWPDSLWAAATPPGPDLPALAGNGASRCHRHRRRLHRPVDCAASARGGRGCRHRRSDGARAGAHRGATTARSSPRCRGPIPTTSSPSTVRRANASSRCCATAPLFCSSVARRYQIQAEQEQSGWVQPVHSPGRIKIAERRVQQWSKSARRSSCCRASRREHARFRCMVRRFLEQDRRSYQSAGAVARSCPRGAGAGRPHLRALARDQF